MQKYQQGDAGNSNENESGTEAAAISRSVSDNNRLNSLFTSHPMKLFRLKMNSIQYHGNITHRQSNKNF